MADVKRIKDTDYLAVSARVRALENNLLTQDQYEQLIAAKSDDEAAKLLQAFGYGALDLSSPEALDAGLSAARAETLADLGGGVPDAGFLDVFRLGYDYHNVKAVLKAEAMGTAADSMLTELGRVGARELEDALRREGAADLPGRLAEAAAEGREVLAATRDPQLSDIAVDRWYHRDLLVTAEATGSAFLCGYVRLKIDCANLRALVRALRMGKNAEFLRGVLFAGGGVETDELLRVSANGGSGLAELYAPTALARAAEAGAEALRGGAPTEFEKRCDDALSAYLDDARLVAFGEEPLLAYLAALETEYTNLRIVLMGRAAGVPGDVVRARLRAGFV